MPKYGVQLSDSAEVAAAECLDISTKWIRRRDKNPHRVLPNTAGIIHLDKIYPGVAKGGRKVAFMAKNDVEMIVAAALMPRRIRFFPREGEKVASLLSKHPEEAALLWTWARQRHGARTRGVHQIRGILRVLEIALGRPFTRNEAEVECEKILGKRKFGYTAIVGEAIRLEKRSR